MMKQRNRKWRRRTVGLLVLALALLLCACSGDLPAFEKDGDGYVNPETRVSYLAAPWNYEVFERMENRPVVRIAQDKIDDVILYEVKDTDPSHYLSTENYDLFYASNLTLPTLAELNPSSVMVCQGADRSFVIETITDAADVAAILAAAQARPLDPDSFDASEEHANFTLKFVSEQYPAFYYRFYYRQYDAPIESWVPIENADSFEVLYENADVRVEEDSDGLYAVYTLGVGVIYDYETGIFYTVGDLIAEYLQLDESGSDD